MYYDLGKNRCLQKGNHHWACDARGIATSWQLWIWTPRRKPWNLGMTKHTEWFEGNVNPWIMIQNPQCCLIAGSTFRINWYQLITFVGIRVNETDNYFFYSRLAIIGFWVVFGVQKRCKGITRWAPLSHHSSQKRWFKDLDIWKLQMNDRGLGGLRASPLLPRFCLSWKWIVGPLSTRSPKIQVGYSYPNWKAKEQRELVRSVLPFKRRGMGRLLRSLEWKLLGWFWYTVLLSLFAFNFNACWSQKVQELLVAPCSWKSSQSTHSWVS